MATPGSSFTPTPLGREDNLKGCCLLGFKSGNFCCELQSPPAILAFLDCKKLLQNLSEYSQQIVLHWIPGHCGVTSKDLRTT
ncbi:hypothetical protein TNCV_694811 [Trichonephila clavipes]|nr:hypothetical protein TNCV_694811 [Trichonephila clavipes]